MGELDLLKLLNQEVQSQPATLEGKAFLTYREQFRLPLGASPSDLALKLEKAAKPLRATLLSQNGNSYCFGYNPQWVAVAISFTVPSEPRICLIIDDGGYQKGEALEDLYAFKVPVTVSIIPHTQYSRDLAEEFPSHGVEVMCHMPMEGHETGMVGGGYKELLKKGMSSSQIKAEVNRGLDDLPHCRGLNNHMGSIATADSKLIGEVCQVLKSRGLFIIDSRTTARSVVEKIARKTLVPVARRDVFLDNLETPGAILAQMNQTAKLARKHGLAVAIGHFKLVTLQTLDEAIRRLKGQGFQFVYASEVVR
jgi:polysaccharide deacetylase 2 family uncharacterized protein YibQ